MNRKLYFLFFVWGTLLSLLFVFSQKLFENNLYFSVNLLWLLLMISIPLGAALYHLYESKLESRLPTIFSLTFLWVLVGFILFFAFFGRAELSTLFPTGETLLSNESDLFVILFKTAALQLGAGIILFAPLWLSIGMAELALFKKLADKNKQIHVWSYGLFIVGLAFGQFLHIVIFPSAHPALIGSVVILLACVYFFYNQPHKKFKHVAGAILTIGILVFLPAAYTYNFSPAAGYNFSPVGADYSNSPVVHDEWQSTIRFSLVEHEGYLVGFYNSSYIWVAPKEEQEQYSADNEYLTPLIPEGATVAVIGSGGGAQLDDVLNSGAKKVYAIDVVPNLKETLISLGSFNYSSEKVTAITQDGRKFIQESDELFDVILIPFTETILRLAKNNLEPSERLFTKEAFVEYKERLSENGVIIVVKTHAIYRDIIDDYIASMHAAGLSTKHVVLNSTHYIAASQNADNLNTVREIFEQTLNTTVHIPKQNPSVLYDDSPYTFKNRFFSKSNWPTLSIIGVFVFSIVLLLLVTLRRSRNSTLEKTAAVLVGVNYTLLLLVFQLFLFTNLNKPLNAYSLGLVIFLVLIALGVLLYEKRNLLTVSALIVAVGFFIAGLPVETAVIGVAILLSGGLFTTLLDTFKNNLVTLLVVDGLGATLAGVIFFLTPLAFGISTLYISAIILSIVAVASVYYLRSQKSEI